MPKSLEGKEHRVTKYILTKNKKSLIPVSNSLVKILDTTPLWKGEYWEVYKAGLFFGVDKSQWKKTLFVIKKFRNKENVEGALYNFCLLKSLSWTFNGRDFKIPTWTTYRKIEDSSAILMTYWNVKNKELFSPNNDDSVIAEKYLDKNILEVSNLSSFFEELYFAVQLLSSSHLHTFSDSYCFVYDTKNTDLTFLLGDLDSIEDLWRYSTLNTYNLSEVVDFLKDWKSYFDLWFSLKDAFINFLEEKKKNGDVFLKNVSLEDLGEL